MSPAALGSCRRVTLTCSDGFPVAAPQTQVCRLPLRQGPTRRHPSASVDIGGATRVLILFHQGVEGLDRAVLRGRLRRRGGAGLCAMIEVLDAMGVRRKQRG